MSLIPNSWVDPLRAPYSVCVDSRDWWQRSEQSLWTKLLDLRVEEDIHSDGEHLWDIKTLPDGIWTDDDDQQLAATRKILSLFSITPKPPVPEIVSVGVVPRLVQFLERDDFQILQFAAAWALSNLSCGTSEHTKVVVDNGAIHLLARLINSPNEDVREQAVHALGNIAGACPSFRDIAIDHGLVPLVVAQLNSNVNLAFIAKATWLLSNLCGGHPKPALDQLSYALTLLLQLLNSTDEGVIANACWSLVRMCDGTEDCIRAVLASGVCQRLVELLGHQSLYIATPALHAIGNVASSDRQHIRGIISCGALPCLRNLLIRDYPYFIKSEICSIISSITSNNHEGIQAVIEADVIGTIAQLTQHPDIYVKKEAVSVLFYAACHGTTNQVKYIASQQCVIKAICDLLVCTDQAIVLNCLHVLQCILQLGKMLGRTAGYAKKIDEAKGTDNLKKLTQHHNTFIAMRGTQILGKFFRASRYQ